MSARIRFRTDSAHIADHKAAGMPRLPGTWPTLEEWDATPPAAPGDCWRIHWKRTVEQEAADITPFLAGYALCCTLCRRVHRWTLALNCAQRRPDGSCIHSGIGSCWRWTGSAEAGTLSASPSLWWMKEKGGCGFHGFLTNGVLSP